MLNKIFFGLAAFAGAEQCRSRPFCAEHRGYDESVYSGEYQAIEYKITDY